MIDPDSLSTWLSSGRTDILGTAHEFQGVEVDFGCNFQTSSEECPQVGGRDLHMTFLC